MNLTCQVGSNVIFHHFPSFYISVRDFFLTFVWSYADQTYCVHSQHNLLELGIWWSELSILSNLSLGHNWGATGYSFFANQIFEKGMCKWGFCTSNLASMRRLLELEINISFVWSFFFDNYYISLVFGKGLSINMIACH